MIVQSSRPRPVLPRNSRERHVLVRAQIDRLEVERLQQKRQLLEMGAAVFCLNEGVMRRRRSQRRTGGIYAHATT